MDISKILNGGMDAIIQGVKKVPPKTQALTQTMQGSDKQLIWP